METHGNHLSKQGSCLVYPGEFRPPVFNRNQLARQLLQSEKKGLVPEAVIREYPDHYKIEIFSPGHKKEDFLIKIKDKEMHVTALNGRPWRSGRSDDDLRILPSLCFELSIVLPDNMDTDFVSAEYKAGLLNIWFQRATCSVLATPHPVIVY